MKKDNANYSFLLVEDYPGIIAGVTEIIMAMYNPKKVDLMVAKTVDDAKRIILQKSSNLNAIMVDGSLGHSQVETLPIIALIMEQRKKGVFNGKIIAISGSNETNEVLMTAGCDEMVIKSRIGDYICSGKLVSVTK
ncbi:MAG: hypothetical protein WAV11_02145 [Minisyncoccia bacterium]